MASFLTDTQKTEVSDIFDDIHDTFKRDIRIFVKSPVVQSATDYNSYYKRKSNISKTQTSSDLTPLTRSARILFLKQDERQADFGAQIGLEHNKGIVRIKVDGNTAPIVRRSVHIEIDGILYDNPSDEGPIGPFTRNYYSFLLQRKA